MKITVRLPGPRETDQRQTVTLREPATPWPVRFHFVWGTDADTGQQELVNVGFELGETEFERSEGEPTELLEVDPITVQRIASSFAHYREVARNMLIVERDGVEGAIKRLRGPGRKPARLTDDFYRLIAAEYATLREFSRRPGADLAARYSADPGTVSRWLSEARRRNYLDDRKEQEP